MAAIWHHQYQQKLTSAADAVQDIPDGAVVFCGFCAAEPPALLDALQANRNNYKNINVIQMLSPWRSSFVEAENREFLRLNNWFSSAHTRTAVTEGWADYTPTHFHDSSHIIRQEIVPVDVFITAVGPMDEQGYFNLGVSVAYTFEAIKKGRRVIFEVNQNMPRTSGNSFVHINHVDQIVENHVPLPQMKSAFPNDIQRIIGQRVAELIEDGSTVQLGFGGIPMAMADFLKEKHDLGIHTELVVDAMVDLIECGAVNNHKRSLHTGKITGTALVGTDKIYRYSHQNPLVELHPVDYTNDVATIAANHKMIAVNATLEIDLFGQCVSESFGYMHYSGSGGQLDFVRGAVKSPGGKAILALPSTAKNDSLSRIVPCLAHGAAVTVPRNDTDYIVTEYGAVRLRGKSQRERALALISVAHPNFRDELRFAAQKMTLI
ncbi:MAG: acetyl-CoA hydrolase/transferase family protein [Syntrophomonadaceae bacterium]|nr:acetyl-CoA hydrolase/transferase family protein [Syntrophomonadaceae bacterium]